MNRLTVGLIGLLGMSAAPMAMADDVYGAFCHINPNNSLCAPPDTTTFTESGEDCNFSVAYWDARNDINTYCGALGGSVIGGYSVPSHRRITTGSCHDPDGGNGLGTLHIVKVRAVCEH